MFCAALFLQPVENCTLGSCKRVDFGGVKELIFWFLFSTAEDGAVEIQKYWFEMVKKKKKWKMGLSSGKMSVTPSDKKNTKQKKKDLVQL